jgi:predicted deacylase
MKVAKRLIDISGMRDIIQRRIAVLSADSKLPGPVIWLTACVHGDEVGGTAIVHEVFAALRKSGLKRGSVHAFPLVNSMGFENVSRFINTDREDLNRCFPGNLAGSMGEKLAKRLFDTIMKTKPDLVIDLHNDWVRSVPYVLIDPPKTYPSVEVHRRVLESANATGLLLVEDSDVFHPLRNTLAGAIVEAGVPAFTIEAGGSFAIVEESVIAGTEAVLAVLRLQQMIDVPPTTVAQKGTIKPLMYTNRPLCTTSGLIRFSVSPGQKIKKGQLLAKVYSAFGSDEETLRASVDGFVLGLEDHARVLPGKEVIAIGEQCQAGRHNPGI